MSIQISPGVRFPNIEHDVMLRARNVAVEEAFNLQIKPVLTSYLRPGDPKLHGKGLAQDFDGEEDVDLERGLTWACNVQARLGCEFDVLWHRVPGRGGYHLHVEYEGRRVPPFAPGFYWRINRTREA